MRLNRTTRGGFTLVELMVVIVIIAILAAMAIPKFKQFRDSAKETQTAANVKLIHQALAKYGADHNGLYPFRVRYYDQATVRTPGFSPTDWVNYPATIKSEPDYPWFAMGLFGGVQVVDSNWNDNTGTSTDERLRGENKHKIIQPNGWTYNTWYRWFNEYTDPLVAQGYLDAYPENPFLKRPMGAIMYGYGSTNENGTNIGLDRTLPYEEVIVSPGDFVYTHFYHIDDGAPKMESVVPGQVSYAPPANSPLDGLFYTDHVDSYHLWGFGILPINGGLYVAYKNNAADLQLRGSGAKKDWDNSGTKDMFESGMVTYFKVTGAASQALDAKGANKEF